MFRPNRVGKWTKLDGYNVFGESQWRGPFSTPYAAVSISPTLTKTPIRTDASASNAGSEEIDLVNSVILVPKTHAVAIGDKFEIDGLVMRIVSVQPRYRVVDGAVDHFEVGLENWRPR